MIVSRYFDLPATILIVVDHGIPHEKDQPIAYELKGAGQGQGKWIRPARRRCRIEYVDRESGEQAARALPRARLAKL